MTSSLSLPKKLCHLLTVSRLFICLEIVKLLILFSFFPKQLIYLSSCSLGSEMKGQFQDNFLPLPFLLFSSFFHRYSSEKVPPSKHFSVEIFLWNFFVAIKNVKRGGTQKKIAMARKLLSSEKEDKHFKWTDGTRWWKFCFNQKLFYVSTSISGVAWWGSVGYWNIFKRFC